MKSLKTTGRDRNSAIIFKQRQVINKLLNEKKEIQKTGEELQKEHDHYVKMLQLEKQLLQETAAELRQNVKYLKAELTTQTGSHLPQPEGKGKPGKADSIPPAFLEYLDEQTLLEALYGLLVINHPTGWADTLDKTMYELVQGNQNSDRYFREMYFEIKELKSCFTTLAHSQNLAKIQHLERQVSELRSINCAHKAQLGGCHE